MGPLIERKGWGPFEEVANAYYRHSATNAIEYFVVGPINGVARIKRLVVNLGGDLTGFQQVGFRVGVEGVASEANYLNAEPLIQRANYVTGLNRDLMYFEVFDSIGLVLDLPLSVWVGVGCWFVHVFSKPAVGNLYCNYVVSVVWDRYFGKDAKGPEGMLGAMKDGA